ncbi:class I SAM-dependent methyltransferase [Micromonospora olivasterospora]|uniref:Ubiquinone/menaquinone biosynthesis C-methylase UbiE n=1 Tax=Micromonospora olivasterospora TaxID=1880 RepID=A0A562I396_MICOL|nr:methyltransferase domain-containing protein [Micromonospora olivasterospora]TWH65125.1 ubiquinone/menaquinone biosynthesis C-methylase UbiE [Micromonospora olivasterospora]
MNAEAAREQQRTEWALSAPGWLTHRDRLDAAGGEMTPRILAVADPRPGDRVLDLACGIGNPSCALAERVAPSGTVLGLDLSADMIEGARTWAARRGLTNVEFRTVASEAELGVEPESFDLATCRVGLQYMPEPVAAVREVHRALRPGGRFVATTLGDPRHCMAFSISSPVIARHAPTPPPSANGGPGPVSLSDPDRLHEILVEGGFDDVCVDRFRTTIIEVADAEACWDLFEETMGPMMRNLRMMTPRQRAALRRDGVAAVAERFPTGPVRLGGEVLIATATRKG